MVRSRREPAQPGTTVAAPGAAPLRYDGARPGRAGRAGEATVAAVGAGAPRRRGTRRPRGGAVAALLLGAALLAAAGPGPADSGPPEPGDAVAPVRPRAAEAVEAARVRAPVSALLGQVAEPRGAGEAPDASAATTLIGAERWHRAGFSGHGVRVAVLDAGFAGYEAALGETLPPRVTARSFREDGRLAGGTDHGLRAAEVVHAIAPRAELYLVNFATLEELRQAIDYLVDEGVSIVSFSLGYVHSGPGDGTGAVNDAVTRGIDAGQLWTVAAGNWGQQQWAGPFIDSNDDSHHEFASGVSRLRHRFHAGDVITVSLRWDDEWGATCSDYDLELFAPDGSLMRASRHVQDCDEDPVEVIQVLATQSGWHSARITAAGGVTPRRLSLLFLGAPDRGAAVDRPVGSGSLAEPADHPLVLTVGALDALSADHAAAPSSSRGPTTDGRPKPDILAPTGASGAIAGGFGGTSAAAPHAAGAAALLREALPRADRSGLASELRTRAVAGASDAATGAGVLHLGSLAGLGLLLPVGSEEARLEGDLPGGAGLVELVYRGPDGYPARFAHLLTPPGRAPAALFRRDGAGSWDVYIAGAPAFVQSLLQIDNGDPLIARFDEP